MAFSRFNAGPDCQDHPAAVGGILDSDGLVAIFAGLAFFTGKSPGDASPNLTALHPYTAAE
jgi:hypothetical protein